MQSLQSVKIGLITDIHYDGTANAMNRLYETVASLNGGGVDALVVMGDLVDSESEHNAKRLLREVSALCDAFRGPIHYMHGNHDLDHISKGQFFNALGRVGDPSCSHFEHAGHDFISIDGNFSPGGSEYERGNFNWREAIVPEEQIGWLKGRLDIAHDPVVVFSHQRIDKDCAHAVQNNAAVRDVLQRSGKVKAVFQGHNHIDDLVRLDGIAYYSLGAHKDGAGPAVANMGPGGIRLVRDLSAMEAV